MDHLLTTSTLFQRTVPWENRSVYDFHAENLFTKISKFFNAGRTWLSLYNFMLATIPPIR